MVKQLENDPALMSKVLQRVQLNQAMASSRSSGAQSKGRSSIF